jgi:TatD DNase family protein
MTLELIDSHAHIDEIENIKEAVANAKQHNIVAIIAVGTSLESNRRIMALAREYINFIYPALGLFPYNIADDDFRENMAFIRDNIHNAIGIGEIGLDYSKNVKEKASKEIQKSVFKELLELAVAHNKPAIIHSRYSWQDCFNIAKETKTKRAIFHWYTGPLNILENILSSGYYVSASPAIEYHEEHRKAIQATPLDKLLLETDSPVTYYRNTELEYESKPADLVKTLNGVAKLKKTNESTISQNTSGNARNVFHI